MQVWTNKGERTKGKEGEDEICSTPAAREDPLSHRLCSVQALPLLSSRALSAEAQFRAMNRSNASLPSVAASRCISASKD